MFTDFYKLFLHEKSIVELIPKIVKRTFFIMILLPFLTNTLGLNIQQLFELSILLVNDPFIDQERFEFFNFIVLFSNDLIPLI